MADLNYIVARVDLAVARVGGIPLPECGIGTAYDSVLVDQLPVGAVVEVAFGGNSEAKFFPLLAQGQSFLFKDDKDCPLFVDDGLFIRNAVGVGVLILIIGLQSSGS